MLWDSHFLVSHAAVIFHRDRNALFNPHKPTNTQWHSDHCVFAEPSLVALCSGRSALSSCSVSLDVIGKEGQKKKTNNTKPHCLPYNLHCVTQSAFTLSQPVRGATEAQEIKCTVTNHNLSFSSLQWGTKGEKKAALCSVISHTFALFHFSCHPQPQPASYSVEYSFTNGKRKGRKANFRPVRWLVH